MNKVREIRDEIAQSIRSVRLVCFGRKCLKDCARRMAAAAPHPRATRRRWGAAVAAVLVCLGAYAQEVSTVRCIWDDSTQQYVCSGTGGSIIEVQGGGVIIQTVTNFLGACTNCVNMTPETCRQIKSDVASDCENIYQSALMISDLGNQLKDRIDHEIQDIATFRRFGKLPRSADLTSSDLDAFTNYVFSVDNSQTRLCRSNSQYFNASYKRYLVSYNNGIYDYANTFTKPQLLDLKQNSDSILENSNYLFWKITSLGNFVDQNLNCSSCPGGGDGTNDCNECTGGRWCTEEQGRAIIELLTDSKDYLENLKASLFDISNNVVLAVQNLHDGLFTSYTHIPTEEDLGHTWQELYLEGYSPNFHEYAATNILARIELLLAGMSGVLTNSSDFADAGDFAENGMDATNRFDTVINDFTNDVSDVISQREHNVRSVGEALVSLYDTFRGWSGTPFSRQTLISSYSIEIGEDHWDVPSFEPSENGLWVANIIRVICRSIMSVIYILFTISVFIRFHIAFFEWVWKYVKWAIELMQGLFA